MNGQSKGQSMTRKELIQWCDSQRSHIAFLANLIVCHHPRPVAKLRGLRNLIMNRHQVCVAQFDIDQIVIDGKRCGFSELERY